MCLSKLRFSDTKVEVSSTGTCTVKTVVTAEQMKIFDDVSAVIDGEVIAEIYDEKTLIGTATMVLPVYGVGRADLTGMALYCGKEGHSYHVKFTSENLWAMEV